MNPQPRVSRSVKPLKLCHEATKCKVIVELLSSCCKANSKLQGSYHSIASICKVVYAWRWRPWNSGWSYRLTHMKGKKLPRSCCTVAKKLMKSYHENCKLLATEQQALDAGEAEMATSAEEDEWLDVGVSQEVARKWSGCLRRLRL